MPRNARIKSQTQVYHVMLRGINKQNIFEESEDYEKMLQLLQYCIEKSGMELYAYCLMTNHIHLLLKEGNEPLAITFRRLGSKFVYWYNAKYERTGHLFQDRFKSEPVEDDSYFLTVLRYIHLNPIKSGLVKKVAEYPYSSYSAYLSAQAWFDTQKALSIISKEQFKEFHKTGLEDTCLDIPEEVQRHFTQEQAKRIMKQVTKCESISEYQAFDRKKRNEWICKLKSKGVSCRQISRLTGETYYMIQKQSIKEPSP